jgi:hypothetical protein
VTFLPRHVFFSFFLFMLEKHVTLLQRKAAASFVSVNGEHGAVWNCRKKRRRTVGDMNSSRAQSNLYRRIKRIASDFHLSQEPMAEKALAALYCPLLLVHRVPWSQSQSPVLRPRGPAGSGLRLRPPAIGEAVCADEED